MFATRSVNLLQGFDAKEGSDFNAFITIGKEDLVCLPNPTGNIGIGIGGVSGKVEPFNEVIENDDEVGYDVGSEQLTLYPNPTRGNFTIGFPKGEYISAESRVEIYSMDGHLVYKSEINGDNQNVLFTQIPGTYLIKIYNNKKIYSKKFLLK